MTLVFNSRITISSLVCCISLIFFWAIVTLHGCTASHNTNNSITIVIVSAQNCESCSMTDDTIQYLQTHYPDSIIKRVDINNPEGAMYVSTYHLWRVPGYLFLDNKGSELYRLEGEQKRSDLDTAINMVSKQYEYINILKK